jgi:ketosteroid isomerase-like protein
MKFHSLCRSLGRSYIVAFTAVLALAGCASLGVPPVTTASLQALRTQVADTEIAFAKTMADRDLAAFSRFIADDAVFLNQGAPRRGKAAIVAHWQPLYSAVQAPFSWKPESVEVLSSGALAQSTGPVFSPKGKLVAHYYSTWRREATGEWKIVLDNGYDECDCVKK